MNNNRSTAANNNAARAHRTAAAAHDRAAATGHGTAAAQRATATATARTQESWELDRPEDGLGIDPATEAAAQAATQAKAGNHRAAAAAHRLAELEHQENAEAASGLN